MRAVLGGMILANLVIFALIAGRTVMVTPPAPPSAADACAAFVRERIRQVDLTADERRWEGVGWLYDVDTAMRLAREHKRPLFVYCLDGRLDGRS